MLVVCINHNCFHIVILLTRQCRLEQTEEDNKSIYLVKVFSSEQQHVNRCQGNHFSLWIIQRFPSFPLHTIQLVLTVMFAGVIWVLDQLAYR